MWGKNTLPFFYIVHLFPTDSLTEEILDIGGSVKSPDQPPLGLHNVGREVPVFILG